MQRMLRTRPPDDSGATIGPAGEHTASADPPDEYDFSSGVRGTYATAYAAGSNVVVLDPDVRLPVPHRRGGRRGAAAAGTAGPRPGADAMSDAPYGHPARGDLDDAGDDVTARDSAAKQVFDDALAATPDVLERLADEALADYRAGRTLPLDPDRL